MYLLRGKGQGGHNRRMPHSSVTIRITPESAPSPPSWLGEVAVFAQVLSHTGRLQTIQEQVQFARARIGTYDLIDFVAVLIGYMVSSEPTLLAFYERLLPFAEPFMALFGRAPVASSFNLVPLSRCPRSAHSRSLAGALSRGSTGALAVSLPWWPI
jgi:hypothetical protein